MMWDIFCRVIDNLGDIGVCWRLCANLAARGQRLRLWVDDSTALEWMAPGARYGQWPGIQVLSWQQASQAAVLHSLPRADVWVEAFGCEMPSAFVAHFAKDALALRPCWINLEYLSAEPYVERCHGLPSPVLHGPAAGWCKNFYFPGFSRKTGGLLREADLLRPLPNPAAAAAATADAAQFLAGCGISAIAGRLFSLFCYEPILLRPLLMHLATAEVPTQLLVTHGRASSAVKACLGGQTRLGALQLRYLPLLSQVDYDRLLAVCQLNFVRGEDSVLRALWAAKPFVWHIYPQDDGAHWPKLEAFMEHLQLSQQVRTLHRAWNGFADSLEVSGDWCAALHPAALSAWQTQVQAARARLLVLDDLATQLIGFVQKHR
ncbi:MAG: elongation factor P maturation arginine rhamnosyltransferase EarP [Rhodoferax sp.]|nr:elongation factor P maturation arginine rhamnosyltransferase EarP [Rhodoferax sp.]